MTKETAEQKLLKLIEGSSASSTAATEKKPNDATAQQVARAVKGTGIQPVNISSFLKSFFSSGKTMNDTMPIQLFGLKQLNRILSMAILGFFAILMINLLNEFQALQRKIQIKIDPNVMNNSVDIIPQVKHLSSYLSTLEVRNIFQPFEKKKDEEKPVEPAQPVPKVSNLTEKLKLVGISWFDSPETASAMIENTENGMTYFVHQGETVKDLKDVTVKAIYSDRVILSFENEDATLKL